MFTSIRKLLCSAAFVFTINIILCKGSDPSHTWGYQEDNGPFYWPKNYPLCKGNRQSPINIQGNDAEYVVENTTLRISPNYLTENDEMTLTNNGHTLKITPGIDFTVDGLNLPNEYKVLQIHFHWGRSSNMEVGSEHFINGISFPLEAHIVTYNEKKYGKYDPAATLTDPNSLAVFGILFREQSIDNPDLANFLDRDLQDIKFPSATNKIKFPAFHIRNLLPPGDKKSQYFQYNGSLTTPQCNEIVMWTVFPFGPGVSKHQISVLEELSYTKDKFTAMRNNHRNPQSLNERRVTRSFADFKTGSLLDVSYLPGGASGLTATMGGFMLSFTISFILAEFW